jgi:hypothetical protein
VCASEAVACDLLGRRIDLSLEVRRKRESDVARGRLRRPLDPATTHLVSAPTRKMDKDWNSSRSSNGRLYWLKWCNIAPLSLFQLVHKLIDFRRLST